MAYNMNLDDLDRMRAIDVDEMLSHIDALPAQLENAWRLAQTLPLPESHQAPRLIALCGMGGSAIGGDLAAAIVAPTSPAPFVVLRSYDLPAFVAGLDGPPDGRARDGVRYVGALEPETFRTLLRRAHVYMTAPRREDYGVTQLEALADGCRVVTTPAPGPYAALPLLEAGLGWVAPPHGLRAALRSALDDHDDGYTERALVAIAPFRPAAVDATVAGQLLPALLGSS